MSTFNGLGMHLGSLSRLSTAKTRSISPENFTGEKGKGGMAVEGTGAAFAAAAGLGQGWKISPSVFIEVGDTFTLFSAPQFSGAFSNVSLPALPHDGDATRP